MIKEIIKILKRHDKKRIEENNKAKAVYYNLSFTERNSFNQLVERTRSTLAGDLLLGIPRGIVYLAIFALAINYLTGISLLEPFKELTKVLLKLWIFLILGGILIDSISVIRSATYQRKLLLNKRRKS